MTDSLVSILRMKISLVTNFNIMKKQSKKHSVYESITNVVIGLLISIITQMILYPLMGIPVSFNQNLIITGVFFVISFIRGYLIRRFFNRL
jgi:high-affinity Fe2+/Pb2+ permease